MNETFYKNAAGFFGSLFGEWPPSHYLVTKLLSAGMFKRIDPKTIWLIKHLQKGKYENCDSDLRPGTKQ